MKEQNVFIFLEYYYPKSQRISAQLVKELADNIKSRGHMVYVIVPDNDCTYPFHHRNVDGVEVVYFKSFNTKIDNRILRAIYELMLPFNAFFMLRRFLRNIKPDYLIYLSPTIFYGLYIKYLVKKFNIKSYLVLRDIFPQWVVDVGLIKENGLIHKFFKYFENINYAAANYIGLESPSILKEFKARNKIYSHNSELLFNWVTPHVEKEKLSSIRDEFNIKNEIIFFYGGNIGVAQDVSNIIRLAESLRHIDNLIFVLMGHGTERKKILYEIKEKDLEERVIFSDGVPQNKFLDYIQEIDVGLMSLNKKNKGHNIPGKLLNYSRYGIPVLGSVNKGNDIINIVNDNNAGIVVENGDDQAFRQAAEDLLDEDVRTQKSIGSRSLVDKIFSVDVAAEKILAKNQ